MCRNLEKCHDKAVGVYHKLGNLYFTVIPAISRRLQLRGSNASTYDHHRRYRRCGIVLVVSGVSYAYSRTIPCKGKNPCLFDSSKFAAVKTNDDQRCDRQEVKSALSLDCGRALFCFI